MKVDRSASAAYGENGPWRREPLEEVGPIEREDGPRRRIRRERNVAFVVAEIWEVAAVRHLDVADLACCEGREAEKRWELHFA